MRVLLKFGYNSLLLGPSDKIGYILQALDGAQVVDRDGYDNPTRYKVQPDAALEVEIIHDASIALPENQDSAVLEKLLATSKDAADLRSKVYKLEQQLKKFTEAAEASKE